MKRKIGKIIWTLFLVICLSMSIGLVTTFADELEITDLETDEDYSENVRRLPRQISTVPSALHVYVRSPRQETELYGK